MKNLIIGTRLEQPARRLKSLFKGKRRPALISEWELRDARDNAYMRCLLRSKLKQDSNCIDVGAHSGFFLRQFLEFAPNGSHLAFEPIPLLAAKLRNEFPGVTVQECALSDQDGETSFQYVPELPGWSGLRPQPYPVSTHPEKIQVKLRRLDDLVPEDKPIAFIKIDVEGAELEVMRGAEKILKHLRPIVVFECGKIHHTYYDTTPEKVHSWLLSCGMGVFLLDQTGPLSLEQFNEVYETSHRTGYDRKSHGNYLAMPL